MHKFLIAMAMLATFTFTACSPTPSTPPVTPPPTVSTSGNISVSSPQPNDTLTSPFTVQGQARVFENQFSYRLKDSANNILAQGNESANAPDIGQFGPFNISVTFSTTAATGTLEVFANSAKDGTEIDMVTIPVKFDSQTSMAKVFFNNNQLDPEITCTKVFPVERKITKTQTIGIESIKELLKGTTQEEKDKGYYTNINSGVSLKSLKIVDGIAYADFDSKLDEKVGGSCRVGAIRAQITETLEQFSTVKSVVISVDGDSETSLQP